MAVVVPQERTGKPGAGLLMAAWIVGLIFFIPLCLIYIVIPLIGWGLLAIGLVGLVMTYRAWEKAKMGEPASSEGVVGGVLMLISINVIAGILAIVGGAMSG
ncbi:hypothetical protein DRO33_03420 [Candidatus Bathyarchaeota archaeon]|nr:MAG: hypothetical protein DRO33_03420 [Candidatus Bathyarchaeota archaeon]